MPLAFDGTLLIVVVTLLEMSLGISLSAGHCANRKHSPTLALFEIRDQVLVGGYRLLNERSSSRQCENHNDKLHMGSVMSMLPFIVKLLLIIPEVLVYLLRKRIGISRGRLLTNGHH
jgi:hypothetical protein